MREELKIFENRSDDWLAKERAYEARVSAWDLDDGNKLKAEHHASHKAMDIRKQNFKNIDKSGYKKNRNVSSRNEGLKIFSILISAMIFAFTIAFILIVADEMFIPGEFFQIFPAVIFIIALIFTTNLRKERR